jgi:hypothetical protein
MSESELRPWSSLSQGERTKLLIEYQPVLDGMERTCSFSTKLERMQRWLAGRGVSITEDEIRGSHRA